MQHLEGTNEGGGLEHIALTLHGGNDPGVVVVLLRSGSAEAANFEHGEGDREGNYGDDNPGDADESRVGGRVLWTRDRERQRIGDLLLARLELPRGLE